VYLLGGRTTAVTPQRCRAALAQARGHVRQVLLALTTSPELGAAS
jgi:hypothetical protein